MHNDRALFFARGLSMSSGNGRWSTALKKLLIRSLKHAVDRLIFTSFLPDVLNALPFSSMWFDVDAVVGTEEASFLEAMLRTTGGVAIVDVCGSEASGP